MIGILLTIGALAIQATKIITALYLTVKEIKLAAAMLITLAKELGIIQDEKTTPEDLGHKALQAEEDGVKPENYNTYQEYIAAVENKKWDPEKSKHFTEEQILQKALEIICAGLMEKYGPTVANLLTENKNNPEFFNNNRMSEYLKTFSKNNVGLDKLSEFLDGKIKNIDEKSSVNKMIFDVEKKLNPEKSDSDIQKVINQHKR